jgi:hypothetical protein
MRYGFISYINANVIFLYYVSKEKIGPGIKPRAVSWARSPLSREKLRRSAEIPENADFLAFLCLQYHPVRGAGPSPGAAGLQGGGNKKPRWSFFLNYR